jgi:acetyl esterase
MPVDPDVQTLLDELAAMGTAPLDEMTPAQARELADAGAVLLTGTGAEDVTTVDATVAGPAGPIPIRVYTPSDGSPPRPIVVYFHGGGFVIGNIATHDAVCRDLAADSGAVLVSVDYRLAPEHPFPAAVEDCWAALGWVHAHAAELGGDPDRLAVAGDSAGGTLAAVVAMLSARGGPPVRFQLLVYPGVGVTEDQRSVIENGDGYLLTRADIEWFIAQYVGPDGDVTDPRVDPIYADDLSGVAPAHVMTAEYDPLRDGGHAYARHLQGFGVPVTVRCYDGLVHGAFSMQAVVPASRAMIRDAGAALRAALTSRPAVASDA